MEKLGNFNTMKNTLLNSYMKNIKQVPTLSKSMEKILLKNKPKTCQDVLVESNLKLVVKIANTFHKVWPDFDIMDLIQEGNIELIAAIKKFDASNKIKLSTYLYYRVKLKIYDYIRLNTTQLKITQTAKHRKIFDNLSKEKKKLEKDGAFVGNDLIAKNLDVPEGTVQALDPLLSPGGTKPIDAQDESLIDDNDNPEETLIKKQHKAVVDRMMFYFRQTLSPQQQYIWDNRIISDNPKTQKEISETILVHQSTIMRMEQKIRQKATTFFRQASCKNDYYDA